MKTKRAKFKNRKKRTYAGIIICLGIIILASISCKSPAGPDDVTTESDITVINDCGVALDIYMDGNFQFSIEFEDQSTIRNLSLGLYEFEAKKKGTEIVIMSLSVEFLEANDYEWTIQSAANLQISNDYGETLSIFVDGILLSDVDSSTTLIIQNILLGERLIEAKRPDDSAVVASITIDIYENKSYYWTISVMD